MGEKSGRSRRLIGGTIGASCVALLMAACGGEREAETEVEPGAVAAAPAPAAAAPADTQPAAPDPELTVAGDGLRLMDGSSESGRPLPFGMPMEAVLATLEGARGKAERSTNEECGAGSLEFANWKDDGLSLVFMDGRFAGWSLDGRGGGAVTTGANVGPGSTRRALEAAHQPTFDETSLGTEFLAGDIGGVLDGDGPDARITNMWAGVNCIFR
ncbi:MAG TPA: hypothetical protein VFR81_19375 [Longimicrobium sp.]|nr:hypothetical protein [Longimicrobium sp.]